LLGRPPAPASAEDMATRRATTRRRAALGLALATGAPLPAGASDPSRVVVPVPPGTSPDTAARLLAERLSHRRGHPLAVENRVGGDGTIGAAAFAQARPGEALFFGMADLLTVAPLAGDPLPYNPATDFVPVSSAATDFFVLSVPSAMPARTLAEFVEHVRAQPPGELNWAGPARTAAFPAFRAFLRSAGLEMAFVPYRGGPQALLDLAEGRIQAVVSTLAAALGAARGGRVRMLATAARARAPAAPELPTAAEAGFPGFWVEGLLGLFGWRGMPEAARDALSAQAREALAEPAVAERFGAAGMLARGSTPAAFAAEIAEHRARWAALAREFGVGPPRG
jgi:tripartite-type tricarboxylate transporter receptor subunit TctC